jgi:hypothetical protein
MQSKTQGSIEWAFDPIDTDLAVALGCVPVSATEQRSRIVDGQIELRSGAQFADIEITPERAGCTGSEGAVFSAGNAHHSQKWTEGDHGREKRTRRFAIQAPMEKAGTLETIFQKA